MQGHLIRPYAAKSTRIRSAAGMPVAASIFFATPTDGRAFRLRMRQICGCVTPTISASFASGILLSCMYWSSVMLGICHMDIF